MKKVAALLPLFFAIWAPVRSQSNWQKVDVPSLGVDSSSVLNSIAASGNLALSSISGDFYKAIRSTDGGATWGNPLLLVIAPLKLKSLSFTFLYGVRGDSIMVSTNQGLSWNIPNASLNLNMNLTDVHYINSSPGQAWAVGDSPFVAITANNWSTPPQIIRFPFPFDSVSITSVQFFDNNFGFAAGRSRKVGSNASVILRTTDGGQSWQPRGLPDTCSSTTPVIVFDFITSRIGWAAQTCLSTTTFYKTTDSGATWSNQGIIDLFFRAFAIDALDSLHAWVAGQQGASGRITKTSNGGINWAYEPIPSSGRLLSIVMKDTTTGFACGEAATLLVYSPISTDVPGDRSNRPKSFELSQNYPNPFNGETRILFNLQKSQPVALTVYNILGQPVRKLLDETRPAGKNEVGWDGRDERGYSVPSGIYLYKLSTREEKQVRKMVLLK